MEHQTLCIIQEYANYMSIGQLISNRIALNKRREFLSDAPALDSSYYFPENLIWKGLIQCLIALKHIHSKNIIHRDIKSANILLHFESQKPSKVLNDNPDLSDATFKITDFNISTFTSTGYHYSPTGTPFFASPEMLLKKLYTFNNDIWSLGVTFYHLITLELPFKASNIDKMIIAHQKGRILQLP